MGTMHSHELTQAAAAVILVIAGLVFVPASLRLYGRRDLRATSAPPGRHDGAQSTGISLERFSLLIAAAFSLAAAFIHFAAVGPHMDEYVPFAYAFATLGAVQVVLAVGLVRNWPRIRVANIALSLGVVALWVVSRTAGLPVGPEPWTPEPLGLADVLASVFEIAIVGALLATPRLAGVARSAYLALVPMLGVIGLVTLIAVAALNGDAGAHAHSG